MILKLFLLIIMFLSVSCTDMDGEKYEKQNV